MFKCKAEVSSHKERRGQQGEAMSQSGGGEWPRAHPDSRDLGEQSTGTRGLTLLAPPSRPPTPEAAPSFPYRSRF